MAASLQPWLSAYLVDVAETHGADLHSVKTVTVSQKGQIIRFLTDPSKEAAVWGMLSDGGYSLPIKFAKDVVDEDRRFNDEPLVDHCILVLQHYRAIFCRAPQGNNSGMESESRLVIECFKFSRSMRQPKEILGMPKPVASNPDLKLWTEGLRQAGGAGNILKGRKTTTVAVVIPELKVPKLIARSKARLPTELFVQFLDLRVYNDRKLAAATPSRSSQDVVAEWSPTPDRKPVSRLRPSQVLLNDYDGDSSQPQPQEATLEEEKMEIDSQRPVSYEQPYPSQSRKVPRPPSPKRLPKVGSGVVLVPNSDVSMAGSSQPSQERIPMRRALSQRDLNCPPQPVLLRKRKAVPLSQETYDGDEESVEAIAVKRTKSSYPWPVVSAKQVLAMLEEADARRGV